MRIIVDTNIIFSAIISPKGLQRDTLIKAPKRVKLYAPYYLREEILEHLPRLQKISGLTIKEVNESYELITKNIFFFSEELIPLTTWMQAYEEMKDTDMDDIPFVASAIHLKARLWTGDKKITKYKKKNISFKTITTKELKEL
jgi:predicted nucleic acid-binding protein